MHPYPGEHKLEGQGLVEYALIMLLVALVVIATLGTLGEEVIGAFSDVGSQLANRVGSD